MSYVQDDENLHGNSSPRIVAPADLPIRGGLSNSRFAPSSYLNTEGATMSPPVRNQQHPSRIQNHRDPVQLTTRRSPLFESHPRNSFQHQNSPPGFTHSSSLPESGQPFQLRQQTYHTAVTTERTRGSPLSGGQGTSQFHSGRKQEFNRNSVHISPRSTLLLSEISGPSQILPDTALPLQPVQFRHQPSSQQ
jgi:hypothetical protein